MSPKSMKTYATFEAWYKAQPANQRRMLAKLRKLVNSVAPKLVETSKWANGVWLKGDLPIIYLHSGADHVQLGFFAGATFTDPKKILNGKGKFVRHLRVEQLSDIEQAAFATMIRKAVKAPPYR